MHVEVLSTDEAVALYGTLDPRAFGREVALKLMRAEPPPKKDFRQRFRLE